MAATPMCSHGSADATSCAGLTTTIDIGAKGVKRGEALLPWRHKFLEELLEWMTNA